MAVREWTDQEIGAQIREFLIKDLYLDLEPDGIEADDSLVEDLGLGSLDLSELRACCEQRFELRIDEVDFNPVHFHSVGTLVDLVARLLRGSADTAV